MIEFLSKIPIVKKLIPKFFIIFYKIQKKQRSFHKIKNFYMLLDINEPVDREIIIFKKYEKKEIEYLKNFIKKKEITSFIDIGANSGYYTFLISNIFPKMSILAFEPNRDAFEKLNISKQKNQNYIELYNFGLSNKNSILKLRSLKKKNYIQSGGSTIHNRNEVYKNEVIYDAEFKIGDEIINKENEKVALKIDVEGHEIQVLQGIKNLLLQNKVILQIEIFKKNYNQVNKYLEDLNYNQIFHIQSNSNFFYSNFND